jgi:hypothetical protein
MARSFGLRIDGTVLTPIGRDADAKLSGLNVTPEGLSPNFGNHAYHQDLMMWLVHNAKERTLDESIALG